MAIRELGPATTRKVAQVRRLSLVAPLSNLSLASLTDAKRDSKNFVMICVSIATAGLMAMFTLNIALTEGAFTVRALKLEVIEMKELRQPLSLNWLTFPRQIALHAPPRCWEWSRQGAPVS